MAKYERKPIDHFLTLVLCVIGIGIAIGIVEWRQSRVAASASAPTQTVAK